MGTAGLLLWKTTLRNTFPIAGGNREGGSVVGGPGTEKAIQGESGSGKTHVEFTATLTPRPSSWES